MKIILASLIAMSFFAVGSLSFAQGGPRNPGGNAQSQNDHKLPTFEEWVAGGKKIPSGLVFTGGSPTFDESTGKERSDEEVYKLIFERPDGGGKRPGGGGQLDKGDHPKPPRPFEPKHPPRPEPDAELKGKLDAYKVAQDALRDALKAKIDQELGEDATRDEIKAVADAFKADNKDAIEAQIAAAKDIHEAMKANRPEREKIDRPEPPAEVKAAAGVVRAKHKDLVKARLDLHKDLKDATDEEKKEKIAAFKDSQRDQHKDLKDAKKALREAIRDNAQKETGSRRGED